MIATLTAAMSTATARPVPWAVKPHRRLGMLLLMALAMSVGLTVAEFQRVGAIAEFSIVEQVGIWVWWWGCYIVTNSLVLTFVDRLDWPRPAWYVAGILLVLLSAYLSTVLMMATPLAELVERTMPTSAQALSWYMVWHVTFEGVLLLVILDLMRQRERAQWQLQTVRSRAQAVRRAQAQDRLKMIQARVDPQLLFDMLDAVKRIHAVDPERAEAVLEALIDFLRAALPRLRSAHSTIEIEFDLVASYVRLISQAQGQAIEFVMERPPALESARFPAGVLLPLVTGLVPRAGLAQQLTIVATEDAAGLHVRLAASAPPGEATLERLRGALEDLYGNRSRWQTRVDTDSLGRAQIQIDLPKEETLEP